MILIITFFAMKDYRGYTKHCTLKKHTKLSLLSFSSYQRNLNNNGRTRRPGPSKPLKPILKPATSGSGSSVDKPAKKKRQKVCFEVPDPRHCTSRKRRSITGIRRSRSGSNPGNAGTRRTCSPRNPPRRTDRKRQSTSRSRSRSNEGGNRS